MDLHPCAVEFVLEGRLAKVGKDRVGAVGRLRQHRLQRPKQLQRKVGEPGGAGAQCPGGHGGEIAAQHDGTPHRCGVQ